MRRHLSQFIAILLIATATSAVQAELKLPAIVGDNLVLQRDMECPIWGWTDADATVTVKVNGKELAGKAGSDGKWTVKLPAMKASSKPMSMTISDGKTTKELKNILVGEVWICSGQSNMAWPVDAANDPDLEKLTANFPNIRLISVPQVGTQEPQNDFNGQWEECSPQTVGSFSAVGYFFGRQLHQTLDVPIGLIDNAWGGSAAEAWVRRDVLEADDELKPLMDRWKETESKYDYAAIVKQYQEQLANWKIRSEKARSEGKPIPGRPRAPRNQLTGNHRPANIFNGVLHPTIGYGIRGVIWYQGESNANRAYQYRHLFPLMISHWRELWGQGDFPFYWVQLADFRDEVLEPGESDWAELREAQTMTQKLPNTGQAVIVDLGEAHDIHPKDKQNVAKRLARLALAKDYGYEIAHRSPEYKSMEQKGNSIIVTMDHVGGGLDSFDTRQLTGFTIAGDDKKFVHANARIIAKDKIEVSSPEVKDPVSVRYAWATNPIANLQSKEGLQATPFRTDDWPGVTINNK